MLASVAIWLSLAVLPAVQGYDYVRADCPQLCTETGLERSNWTNYHDFDRWKGCEETYVFEMAVYTPQDAPFQSLAGCTGGAPKANTTVARRSFHFTRDNSTAQGAPLACGVPGSRVETRQTQLSISPSTSNSSASAVAAAAEQLSSVVTSDKDCDKTFLFSRSGDAVVAIYVGSQVQKASAAGVLKQAVAALNGAGVAEVCTEMQGAVISTQTVGVFISTNGDVAAAQRALVQWDSGKCMSSDGHTTAPATITILSGISAPIKSTPTRRDTAGTASTCSYVAVATLDSCWSLATQKCGISTTDFYKYNANGDITKFCNDILPGDYVCCSAGDPPDFSPKPNGDGTCASYTAQKDDTCKVIAAKFSIKDYHKLDDYNKNTWGWQGCAIGPGLNMVMCVSSGSPNMPSQSSDYICGPQVPGTKKPTNNTDWALLNQCPLNSCCDIWGQCGEFSWVTSSFPVSSLIITGTTTEFCVDTRDKDTMAPGTAKAKTNGCISNCGTDIVNKKLPGSFSKIGYFESWNMNRA
jgi:chitinase